MPQDVQLGLYSFININELDIEDSDGWKEYVEGFINTTFLMDDRREEEEEMERNQQELEEIHRDMINEENLEEGEDFYDEMGINFGNNYGNINPELLEMLLEALRQQQLEDDESENGDENEEEEEDRQ